MTKQIVEKSIEIKGIFDNPSLERWEEITKKMLKTEDLNKKLLFKSIEGFDLFPLNTKTNFVCELSSFPEEVKLSDKLDTFDIDISKVHNAGASIIQELSYGIHNFIKAINEKKNNIDISIALDSLYFANIAKLRAIRFLFERLNEEAEHKVSFIIHGQNSLREQTLFDPWVNMLRNVTSSMAAVIGGANTINSYSYDELYTTISKEKNSSLGERQSINHLKILLEESHLSQVKDYSRGSYTIENLTRTMIEESWKLSKSYESEELFAEEVNTIANKRRELARSRKITITGVNNFANAEESLENIYQNKFKVSESTDELFPVRHVSFEFDKLRSDFDSKKNPVSVVLFGNTSKLSGRSNFCQNYFEVLGARVEEILNIDELKENQHVVICATDDDYKENLETYIHEVKKFSPKSIYLAGKYDHGSSDIKDCLFMGQDIYKVLFEFKTGSL
jgi:hypothetical protein